MLPQDQFRLHLHLDEAVVGDLGYRVRHNSIGDPEVPGPQLVELVAPLVGHRSLYKSRGESSLGQGGVHFIELPVEVSSHDDLGSWILPDDPLG